MSSIWLDSVTLKYDSSDLHRRANSFEYERRVKQAVKNDPILNARMNEIARMEMEKMNMECGAKSSYTIVEPTIRVGVTLDDVFESAMTGRPIARVEIGNVSIKRTGSKVRF